MRRCDSMMALAGLVHAKGVPGAHVRIEMVAQPRDDRLLFRVALHSNLDLMMRPSRRRRLTATMNFISTVVQY